MRAAISTVPRELPGFRAALARVGERGVVIALGAWLACLLLLYAPALVVQDTWLALVAGREVARGGLPTSETLTLFASGREWTDQQWLSHLVYYGAAAAGGGALVAAMHALFVASAFALAADAALRRGARHIGVAVVFLAAVIAGPWAFQIRTQGLALVLFAAMLWLLVDPTGLRRRTYLVLPLVVVWANVHGSVVVGALIVSAFGIDGVVRSRSWRYAPFVVLPPALVFASPYGPELFAYYRVMLVDQPFAGYVMEWGRTTFSALTAPFFVLAGATVAVLARRWRSLTSFELLVLAATLVGALVGTRYVVWFALVVLATVPPVLARTRGRPRGSAAVGLAACCIFAIPVVLAARLDEADVYRDWSPQAAATVRDVVERNESARVFADDRHADWLLWAAPQIRGRLAYDVRFELLTREEIAELANVAERRSGWRAALSEYEVVVVGRDGDRVGHEVVYRDANTTVAVKP